MKRRDLVTFGSLVMLASFVGREAVQTHARRVLLAQRTASFGATRVSETRVDELSAPALDVADSAAITVAFGDVRRRLELGAPGTYIGEMLLARDSALTRWPDRRSKPLRVWVQPTVPIRGFDPEFVPIARDAFVSWSEVGIPLSFTFVLDSSTADVHVTWIDHFNETISGKTLWAHDDRWWIVDAQIVLALHHRSGEALDQAAMRAISLHEVGHLIGLDHTSDTTSIMTPKVRVKELSTADRATAQLLYLLPPGLVGKATSGR